MAKDAGGHGSDPRGSASSGVQEVGKTPLTEKAKWNTFAGGTGARNPNVNSYSARTNAGEYHINPPQGGSGRSGWSLQFADTKGIVGGGLWHDLGSFSHPNQAKGAAQAHLNATRTRGAGG